MEELFKVTAEEPGLSPVKHVIASGLDIRSAFAIRQNERDTANESDDPIAKDVKYRVEKELPA